jgi:hypothetical protein
MKRFGLIMILFAIAIILVILFKGDDSFIKNGGLYISEIVASNSYTYKDNDGEYSDYIEIYNDNDYDIDLENYRLTDSIYEVNKWRFPSITIKAHEYLVIFASGKNKCKESDKCHVNFKLTSDGETISLIDGTGNIISRVTYSEMKNDTALSYVKGKYLITKPTPGEENSSEEIKDVDVSKYKIKITEYLTHNKGANYNSSGEYSDWVEIYNYGDDVSLLGLSLTDEEKNLNKFMLPDVVIKKGEYLVIYLNGGKDVEGSITANFKLSDNDQKIIIAGNRKIIDSVDVVKLEKNMSYGLKDDKWLYFYTPTPGKENNTHGVERIEIDGNT